MNKFVVAGLCGLALVGCETSEEIYGPRNYQDNYLKANMAGVWPLLDGKNFDSIDLIALVNPARRIPVYDQTGKTVSYLVGGAVSGGTNPRAVIGKTKIVCEPSRLNSADKQFERIETSYELLLAGANCYSYLEVRSMGYLSLEHRRNSIQDRIIAASEQYCLIYKNHVASMSSTSDFFSGSVATIFGGLATIFSDVETVRAMAGLSGISSGIGAEFSQSYLYSLTFDVISKGIDVRQDRLREQISTRRGTPVIVQAAQRNSTDSARRFELSSDDKVTAIDRYSLEEAITDALRYHAACTTISGLEEAAVSIDIRQNPGIDQVASILKKVGVLQSQMLITSDHDSRQQKILVYTSMIKERTDAKESLKIEKEKISQKVTDAQAHLGELQNELSALKEKLNDPQLEGAEATPAEGEGVEDIKTNIEKKNKEILELERELAQLKGAMAGMDAEMQRLQNDIGNMKLSLDAEIQIRENKQNEALSGIELENNEQNDDPA
ncbi:hypothetical protein [Henriciella litoralis]|uniref:hypothetical protein n=1 Tax=Henriciella litoralis TaxID=568102 RepID=UPI000A01382E|nr:hypothetical protein [Henriciella litoralis]